MKALDNVIRDIGNEKTRKRKKERKRKTDFEEIISKIGNNDATYA